VNVRPRRIGHIGLAVREITRMADFYVKTIGMQVSDRLHFPDDSPFSEGAFLRCNTEHHVISMFELRDPSPPQGDTKAPRPGMHHFAFELATFEELQRAVRYVREQGIPIQGTRTGGPGSQLRLYFWDPEDNMIELYWAMDQVGWDGKTRDYPPIEPIDLESFDVEDWLAWKGPEFTFAPTRSGLAEPS
jgi:catechol-2,3-dioxygenase